MQGTIASVEAALEGALGDVLTPAGTDVPFVDLVGQAYLSRWQSMEMDRFFATHQFEGQSPELLKVCWLTIRLSGAVPTRETVLQLYRATA